MDIVPWYVKYWKILTAAVLIIGTGLLIAISGKSSAARKNMNNLNKAINDIDAEQTHKELEEHKVKALALQAEKDEVVAEQGRVRKKLEASPSYDRTKSDAENLDTLRKEIW